MLYCGRCDRRIRYTCHQRGRSVIAIVFIRKIHFVYFVCTFLYNFMTDGLGASSVLIVAFFSDIIDRHKSLLMLVRRWRSPHSRIKFKIAYGWTKYLFVILSHFHWNLITSLCNCMQSRGNNDGPL